MKRAFREVHLSKKNMEKLVLINSIIEQYSRQGYRLTLRQLYYQLVTRNVIANKKAEYSKLSTLLKEGRMSGIVDWNAIEDRLRIPDSPFSVEGPEQAIDTIINAYALPRMRGQTTYIEVWVEKDALSNVVKRATRPYHIPVLVNRGYGSVTAMHDAYVRFSEITRREDGDEDEDESAPVVPEKVVVLYLGDFDPSGQDMIRDIYERIEEFNQGEFEFEIVPIALTKDQIHEHNPPPNPAKITDPRAKEYIREHGRSSWEVDALKPEVLNKIITGHINRYIDRDVYDSILAREKEDKITLESLKEHLDE